MGSGEKKTLPYSYHTFLYPFLWDNHGTVGQQEFRCVLGRAWKEDYPIKGDGGLSADPLKETDRARWDYQAFQYFNPSARQVLFSAQGDAAQHYVLNFGKKARYIIITDDQEIALRINAIRFKLFKAGVAIMVFETEYYPDDQTKPAPSPAEAVRFINEYGRRLYPEFLPKERGGFILGAAQIRIEVDGAPVCEEKLRERAELHLSSPKDPSSYLNDPIQLPEIIGCLLGYGGGTDYGVIGNRSKIGQKQFYIEPAIDDRMFVCCCLIDEDYTNSFIHGGEKGREQTHDWRFLSDWEKGRELYALTNIDGRNATCQNRVMLDQCFEEQLYLRWIEYGTIYAVTSHAMVCLTSPKVEDEVVNPFLLLYVPMCMLVLAQRASLIAFDSRSTAIVCENGDRRREELIKLVEDFAGFQGQLLLPEVTSQIQGIELYEQLQKMLFIEKLENNIQGQLSNLYEINEAAHERRQKSMELSFNLLAGLAIISALTDIAAFIGLFFHWKTEWLVLILSLILVALFTAVLLRCGDRIAAGIARFREKHREDRRD